MVGEPSRSSSSSVRFAAPSTDPASQPWHSVVVSAKSVVFGGIGFLVQVQLIFRIYFEGDMMLALPHRSHPQRLA